jgi:NTP pyrophosphatase (non-canonical NTP hydrolase)
MSILDDYQQLALRTENTPEIINGNLQLSRLIHAMVGLATETGEFQDAVKKHLFYGKPLDLVNLVEESADILWYLAVALDACGTTFEDAMTRNIQKLRVRYPIKYSNEEALTRNLDAERGVLEGETL